MNGDTTITITMIIAVLGAALSVINVLTNFKKDNKSEAKMSATEMTTVIVKLESVQDNIRDLKNDMQQNMKDIKADISGIKQELDGFRERIVVVEQSAKSMHHRLDEMKKDEKKD